MPEGAIQIFAFTCLHRHDLRLEPGGSNRSSASVLLAGSASSMPISAASALTLATGSRAPPSSHARCTRSASSASLPRIPRRRAGARAGGVRRPAVTRPPKAPGEKKIRSETIHPTAHTPPVCTLGVHFLSSDGEQNHHPARHLSSPFPPSLRALVLDPLFSLPLLLADHPDGDGDGPQVDRACEFCGVSPERGPSPTPRLSPW